MSDYKSPVLNAVQGINDAFDDFKKSSDKKQAEMLNRIEQIESVKDRPAKTGGVEQEQAREGLGTYFKGLGRGDDNLKHKGLKILESKVGLYGTATAGGNTVETVLGSEIFNDLREAGGITSLVRWTKVDTAPQSYKRIIANQIANSGWAAEQGTRSATDTPQFNVAVPSGGMLFSVPSVSEELLNSSAFDIADFIVEEVKREFASQISQSIIDGSGTNRPKGIQTLTPVSTADNASPLRAFNVHQYLPTGNASGFQTEAYAQASPITDPSAVFYNAMAALQPEYHKNAKWVMSSSTLAALGKLRDLDGRSIYSPSLNSPDPMMLLGFPIVLDNHMDALGSNNFPVYFGDFDLGFEIASNFDIRVTVDELSTYGTTAFYCRSWLGGCSTLGSALKLVKCATS
jgi:HK97 family phage major capsid protein